jgi:hypothetical protein
MPSAEDVLLVFYWSCVANQRCRECSSPTWRTHAEIPREHYVWVATVVTHALSSGRGEHRIDIGHASECGLVAAVLRVPHACWTINNSRPPNVCSVETGSISRHIYVFSTQIGDCFQSQLALRYQLLRCSHAFHHPLVPDSDSLYHRLFSHPRMVEGLVCEFVPQALTAGLDFSALQRVNPKFHSGRRSARLREADVIWRLPTREGGDYLYLLIEFQSEIDGWMAVRTQVYQGLLWQQVIDEHKLQTGARLPPLLLLVLYNGERRWKVATTTRELIGLAPDSALWPWQPQIRYHLLDLGAFPKDELARRCSLTALLFRLEQRHSPEGLNELLDEVIGWFRRHEGCERLQGLFAELIREAAARGGVKLSGSGNLLEMKMKTVLARQFEAWREQWRTEGKAEALICLLAERFGAVAPSWRKRIRAARLVTLERWFKRAIVAPDLPSVFNPRR